MKNRKKDLIGIMFAGIVTGLVVLVMLLWAIPSFIKGEILSALFPILAALALIFFSVVILKRKFEEVKKGFPARDERTKKIFIYAGYKTFLISLYWLLGISFAEDYGIIQFRDVQQAIGVGILGMSIIFGLSYLWINKRGVNL